MATSFHELTKEEKAHVVGKMPDTTKLDKNTKAELEKAIKYPLVDLDAKIRSLTINMGDCGQNHYFAVRALNTPGDATEYGKKAQLVGQQYFGLNRFFPEFLDIADIEVWAVFQNGNWDLHTWNQHGEHLVCNFSGTGKLVTGYLNVNGQYLGPEETLSFVHGMRRRENGNFGRVNDQRMLQYTLSQLEKGQQPLERRLRRLQDLRMTDSTGKQSYILRCKDPKYAKMEALDRKKWETKLRLLRKNPDDLADNDDVGPHGDPKEIKKFYFDNKIMDLVNTKNPSYDKVECYVKLDRECFTRFGFTLSQMHLVNWPQLVSYAAIYEAPPAVESPNKSLIGRVIQALGA